MTGDLWGWWRLSVDPDEHFVVTVTVYEPETEGHATTPNRRMPLNGWNYVSEYSWQKGVKDGIAIVRRLIGTDLGLEITVDDTNARYKSAKGTIRAAT